MKYLNSTFRMFFAIGLVGILCTACGFSEQTPTATPAPTQNIQALGTTIAQTVVANITVQAALNPSPTVEPTKATPTAIPTATNASPIITATQASSVKIATAIPGAWVVQPTYTKTPYTDVCTLVSTQPDDYTVMSIGNNFKAIWKLKNDGMRTWNTEFYIKKVKGDLGPTGTWFLTNTVGVGNEYEFGFNLAAPNSTGTYTGVYKLVNDDGVAICQFFVAITVK